jgi:nucleoside-diphosphate-sugar epimerase
MSDPDSAYGEGKRAAELLCAIYQREHGLAAKIARCFAFAGPHLPLDAHFAIGNFIRDAIAGGPVRVKGDGTSFRSYLYAADLAVWLWTILFRGAACRPYNVGSEEAVSIAEIAETVKRLLVPNGKVLIERPSNPAISPSRYIPSTQRARQELNLSQWIGMEDAMRRSVAWLK